jgi:hypothetical protein
MLNKIVGLLILTSTAALAAVTFAGFLFVVGVSRYDVTRNALLGAVVLAALVAWDYVRQQNQRK